MDMDYREDERAVRTVAAGRDREREATTGRDRWWT
jgi:hypothetical protein